MSQRCRTIIGQTLSANNGREKLRQVEFLSFVRNAGKRSGENDGNQDIHRFRSFRYLLYVENWKKEISLSLLVCPPGLQEVSGQYLSRKFGTCFRDPLNAGLEVTTHITKYTIKVSLPHLIEARRASRRAVFPALVSIDRVPRLE